LLIGNLDPGGTDTGGDTFIPHDLAYPASWWQVRDRLRSSRPHNVKTAATVSSVGRLRCEHSGNIDHRE
jgi:hypothetical protein